MPIVFLDVMNVLGLFIMAADQVVPLWSVIFYFITHLHFCCFNITPSCGATRLGSTISWRGNFQRSVWLKYTFLFFTFTTTQCMQLTVHPKLHTVTIPTAVDSVPTAWPLIQYLLISVCVCSMNTIWTYYVCHVGIVM